MSDTVLPSGLCDLSRATIEKLPERPGNFRLRSSGQRVMLVGHAGREGLRAAVDHLWRSRAVAGLATIEYEVTESPEAAARAAADDVQALRPLYNGEIPRYRNPNETLPTSGRATRRAIHHP